jgi:hypothetical protein
LKIIGTQHPIGRAGIGLETAEAALAGSVAALLNRVCPPLIITRAEIDELMDALSAALDHGYAEATRRGLAEGAVRQAAE